MTTAYPLAWPPGWPRTPSHRRKDSRDRFSRGGNGPWTFGAARDALLAEIGRLKARNAVLSTNYETRRDGIPYASAKRPSDPGVAVYFTLNGKPMVMACDMHLRAEENMRSIALAIEAMRQLERHGGGVMMERAFEGFAALPAPGTTPWWQILQVQPGASTEEIEAAYRRLARERHPDLGGSDAMMAELNRARQEAARAKSN